MAYSQSDSTFGNEGFSKLDSILLMKVVEKQIVGRYYDLESAVLQKDSVISLSLVNKGLTTLPNEILLFKNLKVLDISSNNINNLPDWLGKMACLEELYCRSNKIDKLPLDICNLKNLTVLDFWNNNVVSIPSCLSTSSIKKINFGMNSLSYIPKSIFKISHLEELNLSNNSITEVPLEVGLLKSLTNFDLSYNKLSQLPNSVKEIKTLQIVNIQGNYFSSKTIRSLKAIMPSVRVYEGI